MLFTPKIFFSFFLKKLIKSLCALLIGSRDFSLLSYKVVFVFGVCCNTTERQASYSFEHGLAMKATIFIVSEISDQTP